jgi:hypothetical protein
MFGDLMLLRLAVCALRAFAVQRYGIFFVFASFLRIFLEGLYVFDAFLRKSFFKFADGAGGRLVGGIGAMGKRGPIGLIRPIGPIGRIVKI